MAVEALRAHDAATESLGAWYAPGRVEVLGKHTDYAGGRSLLCAVERGVCLVAAPRGDGRVRVIDAKLKDSVEFPFGPDIEPPMGHWSNYPMTVVRRVARNFPDARRGLDIALASDLPLSAGVSSSSALIVAMFLAVSHVNALERDPAYRREIASREDLGSYLGCVENGQSFGALAGDRGVGIFGGSEDQTAILCCRPRTLSQYSFCPVRAEGAVGLPEAHVFAIANSGVLAEKAGAARELYNRASVATQVILRLWNDATARADGSLAAAVDSSPDAAECMRAIVRGASHAEYAPGILVDRFDQFVDESTRIIPAARAALDAGRLDRFGALVDESQNNVERWLGNQIDETVALQRQARALGAVAASAFGAGFGGSVWALVPEANAEEFAHLWESRYRMAFPAAGEAAGVFVTGAGPAALELVHA
ncbi:MAG: galactokinase [Gemmatimonadota bacterium]|nr:galactokinase [Gemmatimonadota bacterium]